MVMIAMAAAAASGHAGTATVSPALAACSKALVETLAGNEPLPAYTVKVPRTYVSPTVDQNSFTVLAHGKKSRELLAKASCKARSTGEIVSFRAIPVKG
jgi:hypothetical protein